MNTCPDPIRLARYHDGELDPAGRRELEEHLRACGLCSERLRELDDLSTLLSSARREPVSQIELARIKQAHRAYRDRRGLVRMAGGLAAVAASVLVVSGAWIYDGSADPIRTARTGTPSAQEPEWERVAELRADPAIPGLGSPTGNDTADWMLDSVATRDGHELP